MQVYWLNIWNPFYCPPSVQTHAVSQTQLSMKKMTLFHCLAVFFSINSSLAWQTMVYLYCWSSSKLDCLSHTHLPSISVYLSALCSGLSHTDRFGTPEQHDTAWWMSSQTFKPTPRYRRGLCALSFSPAAPHSECSPHPLHTLSSRPPESHSAGGPGEVTPRAGHLWGVDICLLSEKHTVALTWSGFCSFRFSSFRFSELLE